ncbi:MAG: metal ABC transporter permease [Magnetospirillum sp.]|nr:metal ABC transporter permease [Magnetospirillum sp.]
MDELLVRALAAGGGLALVAGPFGCFVVWRRMAYFGDALAHGALLGLVAATAFGIEPSLGVVVVAVGAALGLARLERQRRLGTDTLLGIFAHGALAIGLVALSLMETVRIDLMGWLFGDVLAVRWLDVATIWLGGAGMLAALAALWPTLVAMTVDEDLARVEGRPVAAARLGLMLLVALVVAVAMKIVGILLVTALLVIPAAAARPFARTPEQMAAGAMAAGVVAVAAGMAASWRLDTPTGPSIVVAAVALFAFSQSFRRNT